METPEDEASNPAVRLVDDVMFEILGELDIHDLENVSKASRTLCQMSCTIARRYLVELSRRGIQLRKAAVPRGLTYRSAVQRLLSTDRNWMVGSHMRRSTLILHDKPNADRTFFFDRSVGQWSTRGLIVDDSQGRSVQCSSLDEIWRLSIDHTQDMVFVAHRRGQSTPTVPTAMSLRIPDGLYIRLLSSTDLSELLPFETDTIPLGLRFEDTLIGALKMLGSWCGVLYAHAGHHPHILLLNWTKPTEGPIHIPLPHVFQDFWSFEFLDPTTIVVIDSKNPVVFRIGVYRINLVEKVVARLAVLALPRLRDALDFGRPSTVTNRRLPTPMPSVRSSGTYEFHPPDSGILQVEFVSRFHLATWLVIVIDLNRLMSLVKATLPPRRLDPAIPWQDWGPSVSRIFCNRGGTATQDPYISGHPTGFKVPFYRPLTHNHVLQRHYGILDFSPNTVAMAQSLLAREGGLPHNCTLVMNPSVSDLFSEPCESQLPYLATTLGIESLDSSFHLTEDRFIITSRNQVLSSSFILTAATLIFLTSLAKLKLKACFSSMFDKTSGRLLAGNFSGFGQ